MLIKVKTVEVVEEKNKQSGDIFRKQWACYEQDGQEIPFLMGIGKNDPYPKGYYQLSNRCFGTDTYHKLVLKFAVLEPVDATAAKAG